MMNVSFMPTSFWQSVVVLNSKWLSEALTKARSQLCIIQYPGNLTLFHPEAGAPATFIYVGRMKFEGQKRIKDLLEGMSRAEGQWHLHIIGDGSDLEKCQDYGKTLGIEHKITWHGWQVSPWDVVQNDLKNVTALLLTSSFEGFPMTLLEAMSYGVPCISSDCMSGPGDMIQPRLNGALYPPRDIDSLVELLNKTISGELSYNHNQIPETISMFYEDVYYHNLKKALSKNIK